MTSISSTATRLSSRNTCCRTMAERKKRPATYADLEAVPPHLVAEIIDGELLTHPGPSPRHGATANALGAKIGFCHVRFLEPCLENSVLDLASCGPPVNSENNRKIGVFALAG